MAHNRVTLLDTLAAFGVLAGLGAATVVLIKNTREAQETAGRMQVVERHPDWLIYRDTTTGVDYLVLSGKPPVKLEKIPCESNTATSRTPSSVSPTLPTSPTP